MHNTGNPIGSDSILDLYDNSSCIDNYVNSQEDSFPDRFGTKRLTLAGLIKRSMALRNEINDFSGALTFRPEWSDVPMNVSEGVGGEGGALNLQAEALGNRSEINKIASREALRRTYEEVELCLVEGSFEQGANITSTTDVVLHEKTGKCYSGPIGNVPKGTDPLSGNFVDKSSLHLVNNILAGMVKYKTPEPDSYTRSVLDRVLENLSVLDFKSPLDVDWTNAFNRASIASNISGKVCHIPPGEYIISDSILLWDSQVTGTVEIDNGQYYASKGSRFIGPGREVKIIKTAPSTEKVNAVFYAKGRRSITLSGMSIFDQTANSVGFYTELSAVQLKLTDIFIQTRHLGIWINSNAFVGVSVTDIVIEGTKLYPINYGVRIKSGTSYLIDRVHVDKCALDGYELGGAYVNVGVLSCDNCRGVPYVFTGFFGAIQSLGVEMLDGGPQNSTAFLFRSGGHCVIGEIHLIKKQIKPSGFLFDLTSAQVKVSRMYISDTTITDGSLAKLRTSALLDLEYGTLYKLRGFKEPVSYDTETVTECSIGTLSGTQYRQSHGITTFQNLTIPTEQPTDEECYRIFGWAGNDVGCVGTLVSIRGSGLNSVSTLVMDVAFVAGNNGGTSARAVKKAVSDPAGMASYTGWYQGLYNGKNYYMIKMDAVGTRNLGTFFTGAVIGKDPNLFRVVRGSEISNLVPNPAGATIKTEATL